MQAARLCSSTRPAMTKRRISGEALSPSADGPGFTMSRRDILRYGAQIAPGIFALGTGLVALDLDSTAKAQQVRAVRRNVTTLAARYPAQLSTYEAVIAEMKARSAKDKNDPKGWFVNADTHAGYCKITPGIRPGMLDPHPRQIHWCWLFLPFHRAYQHVVELKMQELSGDKTLAMPYWNWSIERRFPAVFTNPNSALFDERRFGGQVDLADTEVDFNPRDKRLARLGVSALSARHFISTKRRRGFGGPTKVTSTQGGTLEAGPHDAVHTYIGGKDADGKPGDMRDLATAALDPIFFAHHCNIDRLWETWRQDPMKKKTEPTHNDAFMNHSFVFTWLDGAPLEMKVKDSLDAAALGYAYDTLDVFGGGPEPAAEPAADAAPNLPPVLTQTVAVKPHRPADRMLLSVAGLSRPADALTVSVFVGPAEGKDLGEPVGSLSVLASGGETVVPEIAALFDVTAAIEKLGSGAETAKVSFVLPADGRHDATPLQVSDFEIFPEQE